MPRTTEAVVQAGTMANVAHPEIAVDHELMLRPFEPTDAPAVVEAFTTADIQHYHARIIETEIEAREWIDYSRRDWEREQSATWLIAAASDGQALGRVSIKTNLEAGTGEIGYWILPGARGRGVATRAAIAATRWAHGIGLVRVELEHSVHNEGSRRVASAAGFIREGVKRSSALHQDGWHDMVLCSHIAAET